MHTSSYNTFSYKKSPGSDPWVHIVRLHDCKKTDMLSIRENLYHVPCALSIIFTALSGHPNKRGKEKNAEKTMAPRTEPFFLTKQICPIQ